jgi:hypothetical protein
MHRCLDDAERYRVHADAAPRVFDRERSCHRVETAFCERGKGRWASRVGMVDEAGRDIDDMSGALPRHFSDCGLPDVEEADQVDGKHVAQVGVRVVGEPLTENRPALFTS